jgi:site-specific recombinase XerD
VAISMPKISVYVRQKTGIPIRTIQNWLGHKSLETTMIYLGVTDSEKLRSNINAAFFQ